MHKGHKDQCRYYSVLCDLVLSRVFGIVIFVVNGFHFPGIYLN